MASTAKKFCMCGRPLECPCGEFQLAQSSGDDLKGQLEAALRYIVELHAESGIPIDLEQAQRITQAKIGQ